ncbi:YaeQ family protein [Methylomonas albis]|nr:YaeQ family protein [Methylomonas albis]
MQKPFVRLCLAIRTFTDCNKAINSTKTSMAISSTINKLSVTIANMDSHYYQSHELTLAQHPSETDLRFMMRLIAFMANASERLSFTKGMDSDEEPDLWQKTLTDEIELWIDLGQPDEKRIRKACGRAQQVIIYTYQERKAKVWWEQQQAKLQRFNNLKVFHINAQGVEAMIARSMKLQCNIQDGEIYLSDENSSLVITLDRL